MLIGNKCDMQDKRQVSREKGEHVCSRISKTKQEIHVNCLVGDRIWN